MHLKRCHLRLYPRTACPPLLSLPCFFPLRLLPRLRLLRIHPFQPRCRLPLPRWQQGVILHLKRYHLRLYLRTACHLLLSLPCFSPLHLLPRLCLLPQLSSSGSRATLIRLRCASFRRALFPLVLRTNAELSTIMRFLTGRGCTQSSPPIHLRGPPFALGNLAMRSLPNSRRIRMPWAIFSPISVIMPPRPGCA